MATVKIMKKSVRALPVGAMAPERANHLPRTTSLSEDDLQQAIFSWARTLLEAYKELEWMHAIPNGGERSGSAGMKMKKTGTVAGILDIDLPVSRIIMGQVCCGLKIELKKPGGKCQSPSAEQKRYMDFCRAQGYDVHLSNDFEEVKRIIINYLNAKPYFRIP